MIIDTFFDDVFKYTTNFEKMHNQFFTASQVNETENGFEIMLAVPGVNAEDLSVELDGSKGQIVIELTKDSTFVSKFKKGYEIPQTIDLDSIDATTDDGVLKITMTRKEEAKRKKLL